MMNYCATHNQFYSAHCVYCGPVVTGASPTIFPFPISNSGGTCSVCGQVLIGGFVHVCQSSMSGNAPGYHVCVQGTGTTVICRKRMVVTTGYMRPVETPVERPESAGSDKTAPLGRKTEVSPKEQ
jgi:hypothetical protein